MNIENVICVNFKTICQQVIVVYLADLSECMFCMHVYIFRYVCVYTLRKT